MISFSGGHKSTIGSIKKTPARGSFAVEIDNLDRPLDDIQTKAFDMQMSGSLGLSSRCPKISSRCPKKRPRTNNQSVRFPA
jgi:hypothetical protein